MPLEPIISKQKLIIRKEIVNMGYVVTVIRQLITLHYITLQTSTNKSNLRLDITGWEKWFIGNCARD